MFQLYDKTNTEAAYLEERYPHLRVRARMVEEGASLIPHARFLDLMGVAQFMFFAMVDLL